MWDVEGLEKGLEGDFGIRAPLRDWMHEDESLDDAGLRRKIMERVVRHFEEKEQQTGVEVMRQFEKAVMLNVLDQQWKEHLANMDYLRRGIHLRGFAQKKPQQEYKREGFEMFTEMLAAMRFEVIRILARVQIRSEQDVEAVDDQRRRERPMQFQHRAAAAPEAANAGSGGGAGAARPDQPFVRDGRKIGRNEPCPCGSGKKYKQCHGKID